ncbi:MAG: hypothetical protein HY381_01855 [Candidatus Chisholmbacteria bacterium]|nr:hypothetical protein [Candidatus Chisholmbacteria bacterium]
MTAGKKTLILTTFLILTFFNFSRVIGWNFFAYTQFWQTIVYDNYHHWQIGILLLALTFLLRKNLGRLKYMLLGISTGMIIDESMYLFYPSYWKFNLYSLPAIIFQSIVFIIFALIVYWLPSPTLPVGERR